MNPPLRHNTMSKSLHVAGWATLLCFTSLNIVNYAGLYRTHQALDAISQSSVIDYCKC